LFAAVACGARVPKRRPECNIPSSLATAVYWVNLYRGNSSHCPGLRQEAPAKPAFRPKFEKAWPPAQICSCQRTAFAETGHN
jgi:hypothetical protein